MISDEQLARLVANEADMAYKRRVVLFLRWLAPGPRDQILDAACGRGFVLNFVRAVSDCSLVGQDVEYRYVRLAHAQLADRAVRLLNGDLCTLPFADRSFDKVILAEVLEHLGDDRAGLAEAVRVTRPGGLIAISVPNANYPFWWDPVNKTLETLLGTHISRGPLAGMWADHIRLYTLDDLLTLIDGAGLQVEAVRMLVHYCFPFSHNLVYGVGKPFLESGLLPARMANAASRYRLNGQAGGRFNPVNAGLWMFNQVDRLNDRLNEEECEISAMNICVKARVPG
jgi:ubiquinone/menaquinone biosynthesis C-methylase UbiE